MAGKSSDQTLAAIITPAAKPSMISSKVREIERVKKTSDAPSTVISQVNDPAKSA